MRCMFFIMARLAHSILLSLELLASHDDLRVAPATMGCSGSCMGHRCGPCVPVNICLPPSKSCLIRNTGPGCSEVILFGT
ncbi:uncharacterized protein B0H18DRAFT_1019089 [Fomitopsis serialis]|uniref:uncharacterized protein n=1 Tax=Fomitopsis serialis TaxID=139415 RepID=UPI0020086E02|nr:uncharacterized protein B0H18DRAFT_1019089 [Neoantrodia serialis]KAH9922094.1 hypothetical protein B0H18DRAFT_1019089 [Neoantrodia serialis]